MTYRRLWILLAIGLLATNGYAVRVRSLYRAGSSVANESQKLRREAFRRDLEAVLVKVSGNASIKTVTGLKSLLTHPSEAVVSYRYRSIASEKGGGLWLYATFDPKVIDHALAAAGQPIWGRDRPQVIVWLSTNNAIQGDNTSNPTVRGMLKTARKRGLPLLFPLMDLNDRKLVNDFDIRSFSLAPLWRAGRRYGAQALLVGTLHASGRGQWQLAYAGNVSTFSTQAPSMESSATAAVSHVADNLAQQLAFVLSTNGQSKVLVGISGANSLKDEVAVRRLILGIQGVHSARLVVLHSGTVYYLVKYAGMESALDRSMALTSALNPMVRQGRPFFLKQVDNAPTGPQSGTIEPRVLYFSYQP